MQGDLSEPSVRSAGKGVKIGQFFKRFHPGDSGQRLGIVIEDPDPSYDLAAFAPACADPDVDGNTVAVLVLEIDIGGPVVAVLKRRGERA